MAIKPTYEELEQRIKVLEQDAADRARIEEELQNNKEKYQIVTELAAEIIFQHDLDGNMISLSPAWEAIMGYSVEQGLTMNIKDMLTPNSYELAIRRIRERFQTDGSRKDRYYPPFMLTLEYVHKDGHSVWFETNTKFIRDKAGNPVGIGGVARDITERKRAEKALKESEKRFRETAEMLPSVLIEYDLNGILTYVNPHGYKLAGYVPGDFEEGFHILRLAAPEEHEKHYRRIKRMMQGEKIPPTEYRLLRKDGSTFWGLVTSSLIYKDKEVVGVRTFTIDITKRKQAEEALQESEKKYRKLAEATFDGIVLSEDGIIIDVNNAFALMFGYEPYELIGKEVLALAIPQDKKIVRNSLMSDQSLQYETTGVRKDGSTLNIEINSTQVIHEGRPVRMAAIKDITARKKGQQALIEREKQLELQKKSLEEINTAMEVLLQKRQKDKTDIEDSVLTNVKEMILPYLKKIKRTKLDTQQGTLFNILESNLNEITSPFTRRLSLKYLSLTPKEIQIANLIKHGNSTKTIAEIMHVSPRTVDTHRKNIRRKIGLDKKRENLRSHLLSIH